MADAISEREAAADRLVAEAAGLLLEPLPLAETLTGAEVLELASAIVAAVDCGDSAAAMHIAEELRSACTGIGADTGLVLELRRTSASVGRPLSTDEARASLHLLRQGASAVRLRALRGVPPEALQLRRVEAAYEVDALRQLAAARGDVERRHLVRAKPSALQLDLDREIKALRDGGWLFGLIRTTSDGARDRVGPHLQGDAARAGSGTMAQILEDVRDGKRELARLDQEGAARPAWTRWLTPEAAGQVSPARVQALRWVLDARDGGRFGTVELSLLRDEAARRFLASGEAQLVREQAGGSTPVAFQDEAVARVATALAVPATTPPGAIERWRDIMDAAAPTLARAVVAGRLSQTDAAVERAGEAALNQARSPFGPADPSRPVLRQLLEQVAAAVTAGHVVLPEVAHPAITDVVRELGQTERDLAEALSPRAPLRGPLRVAIAGRTKARKTTLRKALTRDGDATGVGRGAHRTTRRAEAFGWHGLEFVDTPGIAAYDDDFDAETALAACRDADGVLWVYAETLRSEELDHLRLLLALGKPVLVVFNAKWRVDSTQRLDLFVRRPHLAFRHLDGHAERVAQVAALAGTAPPRVLPAHLGAAFEALRVSDEGLRDRALASSRLLEIEQALHQLLVRQAQPLRAAALAEAVRTPLVVAAELAGSAADTLPAEVTVARAQIAAEQRDLARCADAAERTAAGLLERQIAAMRANTEAFVNRAVGASNLQQCWQRFVEEQQFDAVLTVFVERLNRDVMAAGVLLEHEHSVRQEVDSTVSLEEVPRSGRWGAIRAAVRGVLTRLAAGLLGGRRLGVRGAARAGARKVPWLGWALLTADAVGGAARGIADETARSRLDESRWRKDAHATARTEIDRLQKTLSARLASAATDARASIESHLQAALTAADAADSQLQSYRGLLSRIESAVDAVDVVLARRLASLSGAEPDDLTRARRCPGASFEIWARADAAATCDDLVRTIRTCLREIATVHLEAPSTNLPIRAA